LREWIAAEREFLAWRSGLEVARRAWKGAPGNSKNDALLMGFALGQAKQWLAKRAADIPDAEREFIVQSGKAAQRRQSQVQAVVGILAIALVVGLTSWWYQDWLIKHLYMLKNVNALTAQKERALKPKDSFSECTDCPEMIVMPLGSFTMGSSVPGAFCGRKICSDL
jgi:hypothetical protein